MLRDDALSARGIIAGGREREREVTVLRTYRLSPAEGHTRESQYRSRAWATLVDDTPRRLCRLITRENDIRALEHLPLWNGYRFVATKFQKTQTIRAQQHQLSFI